MTNMFLFFLCCPNFFFDTQIFPSGPSQLLWCLRKLQRLYTSYTRLVRNNKVRISQLPWKPCDHSRKKLVTVLVASCFVASSVVASCMVLCYWRYASVAVLQMYCKGTCSWPMSLRQRLENCLCLKPLFDIHYMFHNPFVKNCNKYLSLRHSWFRFIEIYFIIISSFWLPLSSAILYTGFGLIFHK